MSSIKTEVKWAVIFSIMGLLWMVLEKLCGLHGKYIDYQLYLTNIFAIPAIWVMVLALKDKKKNGYNGQITYMQGSFNWEVPADIGNDENSLTIFNSRVNNLYFQELHHRFLLIIVIL